MIVRERADEFVMIEQDNHAHVSGEIMKREWKKELYPREELRESVEFAIYHHDHGWQRFDQEPFWNDKKKEPYSFIDFPVMPKTVLYKYGIDAVEKEDPYAGLLCSSHYTRFMERINSEEAKEFVHHEKQRQQRIMASFENFNQQLFQFHFGLLRFGDSISLFICLNEPGASQDKIHPFFRNGIPVSPSLIGFINEKVSLHWEDKQTIVMDEFPFTNPVSIRLKQKRVAKQDIVAYGLLDSYINTPYEEIRIHLTGMF